jgi:hypothetical protein
MATTAYKPNATGHRTSDAVRADVVATWRMRCTALEEKLTDVTAALTACEAERRELSADYLHALRQLWRQNARLARRNR